MSRVLKRPVHLNLALVTPPQRFETTIDCEEHMEDRSEKRSPWAFYLGIAGSVLAVGVAIWAYIAQ